ncbi:MAG: acylphosphatase [Actinomycetota bacterium]
MTLLESTPVVTERVKVTGVVQGVGFRPFVARLAVDLSVSGSVWNTSTAVHIDVAAPVSVIDEFVRRLVDDAPPLARIAHVERRVAIVLHDGSFAIVASGDESGAKSLVPPDAAVCADCLRELRDPGDRRFGHPFITCTNCGPRFTIIRVCARRPITTV